MSDCDAILGAAGKSKRLGFDKIMTPIAGKTVLEYSLDALEEAPSVGRIILATRKDLIEPLTEMVKKRKKKIEVIEGGVERQDSISNGLQKTKADYVLIHDAARPLLNAEMIEKLLEQARKKGSAVCAQRATDTVKRAQEDGKVEETLDRSTIWLMKTPQVFERKLICDAYEHVQKNKIAVTDDAAAVEALGKEVYLLDVGGFNLKITRETDWKLVEMWLKQELSGEIHKSVHAVCNQVNPMIGYLPLLEKHGGESEQFKEYFEKIKLSSEKLQAALKELQQLARQLDAQKDERF